MDNIPSNAVYQDGSHEPEESVPFTAGEQGKTVVGGLGSSDMEGQNTEVSPTAEGEAQEE